MLGLIKRCRSIVSHPQYRDFADMGLGIEARYRRCAEYWARHLALSRDFQAKHLSRARDGGSVVVLGAGRLLDVNQEALLEHFSAIDFYDADPTLAGAWQSFKGKLNPYQSFAGHISDITCAMQPWTEMLSDFLESGQQGGERGLVSLLEQLPLGTGALNQVRSDAIVSANLLSQIPIYWRERVHGLLERKWGAVTDEHGEYGRPLQQALERSMNRLQQQHINQLAASRAETILLLTDVKLHYYTRNQAHWQTHEALYIPESFTLAGYRECDRQSWLWHIVPQGIEEQEYGAIHEVQARCFERV